MQNYKPTLKLFTSLLTLALFCLTAMSFSVAVMGIIDRDIDVELMELEVEEDTSEKEQFEEIDFDGKKVVLTSPERANSSFVNLGLKDSCFLNKVLTKIVKNIPSPPPELA